MARAGADVGAGVTVVPTELADEERAILPTIHIPPPLIGPFACFTELLGNEFYLIMLDQNKIVDLRGEVSRDLYPNVPNYDELPERLCFKFDGWVNKKDKRVRLLFDYDNTMDNVYLHQLFNPPWGFKFIPGTNGRVPRRSAAWRARMDRAAAEAAAAGPPPERRFVDVKYMHGQSERLQRWYYEEPESVATDERTAARNKPKINREPKAINTAFKMLLACLPPDYLNGMVAFFNQRLSDTDKNTRLTTKGEVLKFLSLIIVIVLNPGLPVMDMWQDKWRPNDLLPPPSLGRFGISKNRFAIFLRCFGCMWPVSKAGMETSDLFRYCKWPLDQLNEHMAQLIVPGWILAPDESMCAWRGEECPVHLRGHEQQPENSIPLKHFVERKPEPLGLEIKTTADGLCGAILLGEITPPAREDREALEFEEDWGFTSALNFRLVKPWLGSERVVGADAHFMSVDSVEAMLIKVRVAHARTLFIYLFHS
eukprot:6212119-Pleurochrysis_carterae.AAC.2